MTPAVVLLGGLSRRMGGGDKSLLLLAGETILARILARLDPQAAPIALNANGDPARLAPYGLPVLPDPVPGHPGPLAGILAAMDWAAALGAPRVLTVPGDAPLLPPDLVARLLAAPAAVAAAASGGRVHPVVALWPTGLRHDLRAALLAGERRVAAYAERHGAASVAWTGTGHDPFMNLNTPGDLVAAGRALSPSATVPAAAAPRTPPPG